MKKTINILFILYAAFNFSCTDQLEETIYGTISDKDYWKTEADLLSGLASAYGKLLSPWDALTNQVYHIEELATDYGSGGGPYAGYTGWSSIYPDNIGGIYDFFWSSISYCNKVIDKANEAVVKTSEGEDGYDVSEEFRREIIAEARALRTFSYFTLSSWFGGLPIVTSSYDQRVVIEQLTQDSIYQFMENELLDVLDILPTKSQRMNITKDYGRVTKGGAEAFLARIYLEQKKWQECIALTTKIIDENRRTNEYGLEANYADIFSLSNEGFSNKEIMWALPAAGCVNGKSVSGPIYHAYFDRPNAEADDQPDSGYFSQYYKWGGWSVTRDFYNTFDKNDKRRELLVTVFTDLKTGRLVDWLADASWHVPIMTKFPADPNTDGSVSGNDFIIIRWADVLLMHAESQNELGFTTEAIETLNEIRLRAGLNELDASFDFNNDAKRISEQIYKERRWEFYWEGQGRRTMKRYNKLIDHIAKTTEDGGVNIARYLYLPFPVGALTANPGLKQNSGYN